MRKNKISVVLVILSLVFTNAHFVFAQDATQNGADFDADVQQGQQELAQDQDAQAQQVAVLDAEDQEAAATQSNSDEGTADQSTTDLSQFISIDDAQTAIDAGQIGDQDQASFFDINTSEVTSESDADNLSAQSEAVINDQTEQDQQSQQDQQDQQQDQGQEDQTQSDETQSQDETGQDQTTTPSSDITNPSVDNGVTAPQQ